MSRKVSRFRLESYGLFVEQDGDVFGLMYCLKVLAHMRHLSLGTQQIVVVALYHHNPVKYFVLSMVPSLTD